jgi:hypothetical protein
VDTSVIHQNPEKVKIMTTITHAFIAALNCPTPVTWGGNSGVAKMFTALDRDHMLLYTKNWGYPIDLGDYESVKFYAAQILSHVSPGSDHPMPPPGSGENPWSPDMVNKFGCWIKQGCPQ